LELEAFRAFNSRANLKDLEKQREAVMERGRMQSGPRK
jgi:hypothetical protein